MGVLSFLSAARRQADVAAPVTAPVYTPKPTVESALDKLVARHGERVAPVAARIREAFLWHRTGRKADAFDAFHGLLRDPELGGQTDLRLALQAEIHARLRLCYEREGCFAQALVETALIYAVRVKGMAVAGQESALQQLRHAEFMERYFKPVLERARLTHAGVRFRSILESHLQSAPLVDLPAMRDALEAFCRNPPPPPKRSVERVAGRLHITELHGA